MTKSHMARSFVAILAAGAVLLTGFAVGKAFESKKEVPADTTAMMREAYVLYDKNAGKESEAKFREIIQRDPENGEAWFMVGMFRHFNKDFPSARECFEKAQAFGYRPALAQFNIACGYSLLNEKQNAMLHIRQAIELGLTNRSHFATDPDLQNLQDLPEFKALVASLEHPLSKYPEAVAMEGLIGSWDVFNSKNNWVGSLRAAMTLNWYGIEEHLTSAIGLGRQSLYIFDAKTKTWQMIGGDNSGNYGVLSGTAKDGKLIFMGKGGGDYSGANRVTIQFNSDGSVTEIIEVEDAAKSWKVKETYQLKPTRS